MPASRHRRSSGQAVDLREPEIQNDRVIGLGLREEVGPLAVGGAVHGIAGLAERFGELLRQNRFVLDDQDSHTFPRPPYKATAAERRLNGPFNGGSGAAS